MTYKNTVALWGGGETAGGYQLMTPISLGGGGNQCDTICPLHTIRLGYNTTHISPISYVFSVVSHWAIPFNGSTGVLMDE